MNIAIFASGNGSNLQAIVDAVDGGGIKAGIALVVSDNGGAYALERARKAGIKTVVLNKKDFVSREDFDKAAVNELKKHDIGLVVLAGYMRILTPHFINAYSGRILNIHPSLLPLFKGTDGIGDALRAGVSSALASPRRRDTMFRRRRGGGGGAGEGRRLASGRIRETAAWRRRY